MKEKTFTVRWMAQGAMIAALYVALTLFFAPISFGAMQVRIAEALTILPLFTSAAIPGLWIGCVLGNLLGGAVAMDVVFGGLATLIGAWLGYLLRRNRWLVPIPAIVANTVIVPLVLRYGYGVTDIPLWLSAVYVCVGELLGCCLLGQILASALRRTGDIFSKSR